MKYSDILIDIKGKDNVKTEWINFSDKMKNIDFDNFLSNPVICQTMFFNDMISNKNEFSFIKESFSINDIKKLSKFASICNAQTLEIENIKLNGNIIHHLYHLSRYKKSTGKLFGKNILEWGGGYGNMASIILTLKENEIKNYTIIDLPEVIILQYHYLGTIFGFENINIVRSNNFKIKKINLVPLSYINTIDNNIFDSFLSTWAISESDIFYHTYCDKKNYFKLNNVLIAYHLCGEHIPFMKESLNINKIARNNDMIVEKNNIIPGINYYAFR
jgi:hypothetical protein